MSSWRQCTFPPSGSAPGLRGVRRAGLAGPPGAGGGGRVRRDRFHVDHGARAGSGAEADVVAEVAARFGARFESRSVTVAPGSNSRPAGARRATRCCPTTWPPGTPWNDQAETVLLTCCAGPVRTGWPGWPRVGITRCWGCGVARRTRCVTPWGSSRCSTPPTRTRPFCATGCATNSCRCGADVAGRDPVPAVGPPGHAAARRSHAARRLGPQGGTRPDRRALGGRAPAAVGPSVVAPSAALRPTPRTTRRPPPRLARVLSVAEGRAVATELSGGRRVRRSRGRLAVDDGRARVVSRR